MKSFIIGASGLVGSNTLQYFTAQGWNAKGSHFSFATEHTVFYDTLSPYNTKNFSIEGFQPEVIIHCGALTHVDYCEEHPQESYEKTVQSTKHLVEIAQQMGSKFVYISTDYVFDGEDGPYQENAAVNPLSVYGTHKLEAEQLVQNSGLEYLIIRVAKVFGHEEREKNFVARMAKTIEETGQLKWNGFTDQYTTAINAKDIAKALFVLLRDKKVGLYHLSYGEYFNAYELTKKIAGMYPDANSDIQPITKADFKQAANRPPLGGLTNKKFVSEYPDFEFTTIEDYLAERKQFKNQ